MIWYQTGPYFAYYYTGRYTDVIDLADKTFDIMDKMGKGSPVPVQKNLEESYLWRGRAKVQIGDTTGAIEDFKEALKWHPGWEVAIEQLKVLGVEP
jgi:tetratricopeptide (TPR) repeat protein